ASCGLSATLMLRTRWPARCSSPDWASAQRGASAAQAMRAADKIRQYPAIAWLVGSKVESGSDGKGEENTPLETSISANPAAQQLSAAEPFWPREGKEY